jgi:hypothetical protein
MKVTVGRGLRYNPADDLAAVRALVPAWWWRGLEEVRFGRLPGKKLQGWYEDGVIAVRVAGPGARDGIRRTLVHELAHHADRTGRLSRGLAAHRRLHRRLHYRVTGAAEYLARGAEEFYLGDRRTLEREHRALHATLAKES